jgi:CRISPR/Cas system CSM-associated protein Csm2 small subunit
MGNKTLADLYRFTTKLIEEIEDKDKRMKKIDEYIDILESIIPY